MVNIEIIKGKFKEIFGSIEGIRICRAPGRVNLIGEHTDYNNGFVLPVAIDREVVVIARNRSDNKCVLYSIDFKQKMEWTLDTLKYNSEKKWSNYPAGVLYFLQKEGFELSGFEACFAGDVPVGSGLSSSAALEMAFCTTAKLLNKLTINVINMIKLCQRAENKFVGVQCGIMDQFISGLGKKNNALFIDCKTLDYKYVPLNLADAKIVVCDTKKRRELGDSSYNQRRQECETGVSMLKKFLPQITSLRDVKISDFEKYKDNIPVVIKKRCEHVISENERVISAINALEKNNLEEFGELLNESHKSLSQLYEVSCPELNRLVELAQSVRGTFGARMTGGGFGGCIVSIVNSKAIENFKKIVTQGYYNTFNIEPEIYICAAEDGAGEVTNV